MFALACSLALAVPANADHGPLAPSERSGDVLPDLDQMLPTNLSVRSSLLRGRRVFRLGFASASANVGKGPLTLHGYRRTRTVATMRVDQLVDRGPDLLPRLLRNVGRMRYIVHPDHRHWHLLGFEHYELRTPGNVRIAGRRDRKEGFCLGDRFAIPNARSLENFNPTPQQGDTCGLGQRNVLGIFAGISVGYADRYAAHIEGQYIDVTGMRSGRYVLVHRVNSDRRLLESDYSNDASSVLFSMTWIHGHRRLPHLRVLRRCPASASCRFP